MDAASKYRLKSPPHPGSFVRTEVIDPLEISVTEAAEALGVSSPALSAFLNERVGLSADMALRIEKAFGVTMDTLMRMQSSFDIAEARKREGEITVAPYQPKGPATPPQPSLL
jgi:addiction module HigA family antidote